MILSLIFTHSFNFLNSINQSLPKPNIFNQSYQIKGGTNMNEEVQMEQETATGINAMLVGTPFREG